MARKRNFLLAEFPALNHYIVHVEISNDFVETGKRLHIDELTEDEGNAQGLSVHRAGESFSFLLLSPKPTPGVIAHEAYHCVCRMFNYLGINDEEATAYHLDYLIDSIHRWLRNKC